MLLAAIPCMLISSVIISWLAKRIVPRLAVALANADSVAAKAIRGVRTLMIFRQATTLVDEYRRQLIEVTKLGRKRDTLRACNLAFLQLFLYGSYAAAFWYGLVLTQQGGFGMAGFVAVFLAITGAFVSFIQVPEALQLLEEGRMAIADVWGVIQDAKQYRESSVNVSPVSDGTLGNELNPISAIAAYQQPKSRQNGNIQNNSPLSPAFFNPPTPIPIKVKGSVKFSQVSFAYPTRPNATILKNCSFHVLAGRTCCILGGAISGKTTISQLLLRFYDPAGIQLIFK